MAIQLPEKFLSEMYSFLNTCASSKEVNGPASFMLAQELYDLGKPVSRITLGELQDAIERSDVRYHRMEAKLADRPMAIYRKVMPKGVCVQGRWYTGPELAGLIGEEVTIEIYPDYSPTLIASHGPRFFQIHSVESTAFATSAKEPAGKTLVAEGPDGPGALSQLWRLASASLTHIEPGQMPETVTWNQFLQIVEAGIQRYNQAPAQ